MNGILLAGLVAFLKALWEFVWKIFTNPNKKDSIDEYALAFWWRLMWAFIILPILFFIPFQIISGNFLYILWISAALNSLATVTALKAVKYGDLSIIGPLSAFTIPFLLFTWYSIWGELPNLYGIIGVILIFIGTYFLGVSWKQDSFLWPIQSIFEDKWAKYMLFTAFIWSITWPLDKLWIVEYGAFLWMLYINTAVVICMTLYFSLFRRKTFNILKDPSAIKKISIMTCVWGLGLLLQMIATKLTLVIYVVSIKRASGIFSVLLWHFFFKEKNIFWKMFATLIMLTGILVIVLWGNI